MKGPLYPPLPPASLPACPTDRRPPFDYQPLGRVVFEAGGLARLGALVRELGGTRALLVTDPGLEATGHPDRAADSLRAAKVQVVLFDGVEENPTTKHVEAGRRGGEGSRRWTAWWRSAAAKRHGRGQGRQLPADQRGKMTDLPGLRQGRQADAALGVRVPTTAGTGSEAQSFALIADESSHLKNGLRRPQGRVPGWRYWTPS